jgi:hypothetical protein
VCDAAAVVVVGEVVRLRREWGFGDADDARSAAA